MKPPIGTTFYLHRKKYHVVCYAVENLLPTKEELMIVRRWNKWSQSWVYEVWPMSDYELVYSEYIRKTKGGKK